LGKDPPKITKAVSFERRIDEKAAAVKIAWYAFALKTIINYGSRLTAIFTLLKNLIVQRDRIVNDINLVPVSVNELIDCGYAEDPKTTEKL